jgi:hypothetical protein
MDKLPGGGAATAMGIRMSKVQVKQGDVKIQTGAHRRAGPAYSLDAADRGRWRREKKSHPADTRARVAPENAGGIAGSGIDTLSLS